MPIDTVREVLLWCFVMNSGLLTAWLLVFTLGHDWYYRLQSRWFKLPVERFDTVHYAGIAAYKLSTLFFNLIPYIALHIVA